MYKDSLTSNHFFPSAFIQLWMDTVSQPQLSHNLLRRDLLVCQVHADDLLCQFRVDPASGGDLLHGSLAVHVLADPADYVCGNSSFIGMA